MIKGGFINRNALECINNQNIDEFNLWNENKKQFEMLNWKHPYVYELITREKDIIKEKYKNDLDKQKQIIFKLAQYFNKTDITDKEIEKFILLLEQAVNTDEYNKDSNNNMYISSLEKIIDYIKYNESIDEQEQINTNCKKILETIGIKFDRNFFTDFRNKFEKNKSSIDFKNLNNLFKELKNIKNYHEIKQKYNKVDEEYAIFLNYYHMIDTNTFIEENLEIKNILIEKLIQSTLQYDLNKYITIYNNLMPINLNNMKQLVDKLKKCNPLDTNIRIVKRKQIIFNDESKTIWFEIYNDELDLQNSQNINSEKTYYEFIPDNFSIRKIELTELDNIEYIEKMIYNTEMKDIVIYPHITNRTEQKFNSIEQILITGLTMTKSKNYMEISNYYLILFEKYYTCFISSFLGNPIQGDFIYLKNHRALYKAFIYGAKLKNLFEIFIGSSDKIFNIDENNLADHTDINMIIDDQFLTNYTNFKKTKESLLNNIKDIFMTEENLYKLYRYINNLITDDIVVYYNYILQQNIINEETLQTNNENSNNENTNIDIKKFKNKISQLNNSLEYDFFTVKDYITIKLLISCIYFNIISKHIDTRYILGIVYSLILNYIKNDYNSISNIVNIYEINYNLVNYYEPEKNTFLILAPQDNLIHLIENAYPTLKLPPHFYYEYVQQIYVSDNIGKGIAPCVEMWLFNFINYLIYCDETYKNIKLPGHHNLKINDINPQLLPSTTIPELVDFFIKRKIKDKIIYYNKDEIINLSKNNKIQEYYKAIHNVLSKEEKIIFRNNLKKTTFKDNLKGYYVTQNIELFNELPGRYSMLCVLLSKIFGLTDNYSTDILLKEENFLKFYDFTDTGLYDYPNNVIFKIFELFPTYQHKFKKENFILETNKLKIVNDNIDTWLAPGHGYFQYKNSNLNVEKVNELYNRSLYIYDHTYKNYFNKKTILLIFSNVLNKRVIEMNIDEYEYVYDKFFYKLLINDIIYKINDINNIHLMNDLLLNYNTDDDIEYLNLFSTIYYKYYNDFINYFHSNSRKQIMSMYLNKIISINFDDAIKYPKDKFSKCWLSTTDLLMNYEFISHNLTISIENLNTKNKNLIKTSYITSKDFIDIIEVLYFIENIGNNNNIYGIFNQPCSLFFLLLFSNDINNIELHKIIENIPKNNYILYFLELVYYYKLFSQKNFEKLINVLNKINKKKNDINILLSIIIIIIFMPYKFDGDINKYMTFNEKTQLTNLNILMIIYDKIKELQHEKMDNKIYSNKIFNISILETIYDMKFNLIKQYPQFKFVEYKNKDGIDVPKINQGIFYLDDKKMKINTRTPYIKYLNIVNRIQAEIISNELADSYYLSSHFYIYQPSDIKKIISTNKIFNYQNLSKDTQFNRIFNMSNIIHIVEKNIYQQLKKNDENYTIQFTYQTITTDEVNNILNSDKLITNAFNLHYMICEMFQVITNIYFLKIFNINEIKNFLSSIETDVDYNDFFCIFKEHFLNKIKIVYKGGVRMNLEFEKYKKIFEKNNEFNIFYEKFKDDFNYSNAEYIIIIDKKTIKEQQSGLSDVDLNKIYNLYYYHLNLIVNVLIDELRIMYQNNPIFYYDLNVINQKNFDELLIKLNKQLIKNKHKYPNSSYSKIEKFIGIDFYNRNYVKERGVNDKSICSFKNNELKVNELVHMYKSDGFIKNRNNYKYKSDIFLSFANNIDKISDKNKYFLVNVQQNSFQFNRLHKNEFYVVVDESTQYVTLENKIVSFITHQLKINSLLYFSTHIEKTKSFYDNIPGQHLEIENDNIKTEKRYGYLDNPVKLLNINIPKCNDEYYTFDVEENIEENIYSHPFIGKFKYYSFSSEGYIKDLYLNLCISNEYIWDEPNYEKKLNQLIFFIVIELIKLDNRVVIIDSICNLLKYGDQISLNNLSGLNANIYNFFLTIYNYSKDQKNYKNEYKKLKEILMIKFNELNVLYKSKSIEITTNNKYYNKYLKYKNKYVQLKAHHIQ